MTQSKRYTRLGLIAVVAVLALAAVGSGGAAAAHGGEISVNETVDPVGDPFNNFGSAEVRFNHPDSHEWDFGTLSVEAQDGTSVTVPTYSQTDYGSTVGLDAADLETAFGTQNQIDLDIKVNSTTVATATMSLEDPTTIPVETDDNPTGAPLNGSIASLSYGESRSADKSLVTVRHDGSELSSSEIGYISGGSSIFVGLSSSEIDEEIGSDIGSSADYTLIYDGYTLGTTTIERVDPMVETVEIDQNTTQLRDKTVNLTIDQSELSENSSFVADETITVEVRNTTTSDVVTVAELRRYENETTTLSIPDDDTMGYWSQDLDMRPAENLTLVIPGSGIESVKIGSESVYQQQDGPLGGGGGSSDNQTMILVVLGLLSAAFVFTRD